MYRKSWCNVHARGNPYTGFMNWAHTRCYSIRGKNCLPFSLQLLWEVRTGFPMLGIAPSLSSRRSYRVTPQVMYENHKAIHAMRSARGHLLEAIRTSVTTVTRARTAIKDYNCHDRHNSHTAVKVTMTTSPTTATKLQRLRQLPQLRPTTTDSYESYDNYNSYGGYDSYDSYDNYNSYGG